MPDLTYTETLEWLYALEARKGMDFRLERLAPVLDHLGRPESAFPAIHVAGTNGKGSTAAMLHSVYLESGYRVGLYTSPHLFSFRERIRVGLDTISERRVVEHVSAIRDASQATAEALTFFEFATIAAFLEFRDAKVDLAIVEAGLGGRLDATNVVSSVACVITGIGIDHTEFLGETIESVAAEKAGVVRGAVPVITGALIPEARAVVASRCRALGAHLIPTTAAGAQGLCVALAGAHQRGNAAIVRRTVDALATRFPLRDSALERGVDGVRWPGRFETLRAASPAVIVDAGHNPQAMRAVVSMLRGGAVVPPVALVFGAMVDKDWRGMLEILSPAVDRVYLVPVDSVRSYCPDDARDVVTGVNVEVCASAAQGLAAGALWCGERGTVFVTGSIFLVAELYAACATAGGGGVHVVAD